MTERLPSHELRSPLHLVRCFGQLAVMYAQEIAYKIDAGIEAAWPPDSPEDAEIKSGRWV